MDVSTLSSGNIAIPDSILEDDKSKKIPPDTLNQVVINPKTIYKFGACGIFMAGAQGKFDLNLGDTKVATIFYYSAYNVSSYNSLVVDVPSPSILVASQTGANCTNEGPLGPITVTVVKPDLSP